MKAIRNDWTMGEIKEIYNSPLLELISRSHEVHKEHQKMGEVQVCTLLSVKTGGCSEDCAYCSQSARHKTELDVQKLMDVGDVLESARDAKEAGSTRFCMGAAWRELRDNNDFDKVVSMIKGVKSLDMEVCCTMGMITDSQALKLKEAGLYAYNHNLDTSEEFYDEVITTRTYDDRLDTISNIRDAGIKVCSGGIVGLGESAEDRMRMIHTLATLPEHPESVPVNALVPVEGTPLENRPRVPIWDMLKMIATARITMPGAIVRLSAGRTEMPVSEQALCFMAGANSIFAGDKLLTTPNPGYANDEAMFSLLGLNARKAYKEEEMELVQDKS
ncbi:MAG: biotin synthase BioB [Bacteroidetes bacterium]|nr:biotin synthase BioB [Bacteroidota bacterium]